MPRTVTEVPLGLRFVVWLTESFGRFTTTDVVVAGTALDETVPLFSLVTVVMLVVVLVCEPAAVVATVVDSIAPCVVLVTLEVVVEISPSEFEVELEGDYSGGTHNVIEKDWLPLQGLFRLRKVCPEHEKPEGCQLPNVHCGYPNCEPYIE